MQIVEYRITLPLTLQEYQKAQLFTLSESLKAETSKSSKIVVLRNEPFTNFPLFRDNKFACGQYTSKIYKWSSKLPEFLKLFLPQESMDIREEAWDAYPYCRTVLTSSVFFKERFYIKIESLHVENDCGAQENVHELSPEFLKHRKVVFIDIANDIIPTTDYKVEDDPSKFRSVKTSRGPLKGSLWRQTCRPVMTCYKLVTGEFKSFALQSTFETLLQKFERRVFTNFHRQLFCSIDHWYDLSLDDIKSKEKITGNEDYDKTSKLTEVVETKN